MTACLYAVLHFCADINSRGEEVEKDRPSGPDAEHLQYAKTLNGKAQRRMREERRRTKASEEHASAIEEYNIVHDVLKRNATVEERLIARASSGSLADVTVAQFLGLDVRQLKDFVHARKFNDKTFHASKLAGSDGKLNKTLRKKQTAEEIERECSNERPCLVWLAWTLRSKDLVLQPRQMPILSVTVPEPTFSIPSSTPEIVHYASDYMRNESWLSAWSSVVMGAAAVSVNERVMMNADKLASALKLRLAYHTSERVDKSRQRHWTLRFVRDNLSAMAAAMCLAGHVVGDVEACDVDERLLVLPALQSFFKVDRDLCRLEGCYLYYDSMKDRWVRSGKTSGDGDEACFEGRGNKHFLNSQSTDEMRNLRFYRKYPSKGVENLGARRGYFENLVMYCGMAFDPKNAGPLVLPDSGLFVWNEETMNELRTRAANKDRSLERLQLDAVAYLWEICYDLMLAKNENVSDSPGFEAFGLRVNKKSSIEDIM